MRGILPIVLMLWFGGIGLMNLSCAEKEKKSKEVGKTEVKDLRPAVTPNQTKDVLSGKPINKGIYTDYRGKRIYFCCKESKKRFGLDPDKYMAEFRIQGVTLEDTP
jgi:YHS domain-containing protein